MFHVFILLLTLYNLLYAFMYLCIHFILYFINCYILKRRIGL
nr:MAG TPA: hypothetical protein [Caudoviricetes sp.]